MGYKLVCVDMDGTLLNTNKNISKRNLQAIEKAHELGVNIAICTGRIFTSANYYGELIGVKAPIIASNGAYIREPESNDAIYKSVLGLDNCCEILSVLKKYSIVPHFFTSDSIFTEELKYFSAYYNEENKNREKKHQISIEITKKWEEIFKRYETEIIKVVAADDDKDKILAAKLEFKELNSFEVVSSHSNNFEVMSKNTSKGRAVKILSDFYNISPEEVICIGDNENDISMIEFAGLGVAMGNGEESVKTIADYITDTNDEDGVGKVIEKFIIKNNEL